MLWNFVWLVPWVIETKSNFYDNLIGQQSFLQQDNKEYHQIHVAKVGKWQNIIRHNWLEQWHDTRCTVDTAGQRQNTIKCIVTITGQWHNTRCIVAYRRYKLLTILYLSIL